MATTAEILSLEEINYKSPSKWKSLLVGILAVFLLIIGFLNFYPVGTQLRKFMQTQLKGSACNLDYSDLTVNPLLFKLTITDLVLPASCFNRSGDPMKVSFLDINYRLINFMPFGLPFKIDTELEGQPLTIHYVLGLGEHMIRIKDQRLSLTKLLPLIAPQVKLAGNLKVDLTMRTTTQGAMTSMQLKALSNDLVLPAQSVLNDLLPLPNLKLQDFYLEAHSDAAPRIVVDAFRMGNADAPIRANFKGRVDLVSGNAAFSQMDLRGELAFSPDLKNTLPLDMVLGQFPQKDGFYQIRLGGTLGAPQPIAP